MTRVLVLAFVLGCGASAPDATVVFVCDHGSAKSVVAAALFNAEAARRHVAVHAVARGVTPDPLHAASALRGLADDGLAPPSVAPIAFTAADRDRAVRVVYIGDHPPVPELETWSGVPPVSADYPRARDAMRARVDALVDALATR